MRGEGRDPGIASARPLPTQALFRDGGSGAALNLGEETAPWRFAGAGRRHQPCPRLSGAGTALYGSITTATPQGILPLSASCPEAGTAPAEQLQSHHSSLLRCPQSTRLQAVPVQAQGSVQCHPAQASCSEVPQELVGSGWVVEHRHVDVPWRGQWVQECQHSLELPWDPQQCQSTHLCLSAPSPSACGPGPGPCA